MMLWGDTLKSTLERSQRSVQNVASRSAMLHFWNSEGTCCNTNTHTTHKHTHTSASLCSIWEPSRTQWVCWCNPGLRGWPAYIGSQGDPGCIKSILPDLSNIKLAFTPIDLKGRNQIRKQRWLLKFKTQLHIEDNSFWVSHIELPFSVKIIRFSVNKKCSDLAPLAPPPGGH